MISRVAPLEMKEGIMPKEIKDRKRANLRRVAKNEQKITTRLDQSIPVNTPEWTRVEQALMRLTEFAPSSMILEAAEAIAYYADDQARRAYILGQEDSQQDSCRLKLEEIA